MKYTETACPKCGVVHDTKDYIFDHVDEKEYEGIEVSWYVCPSCGESFHSLEV